jgi:hypothetical protein
MYATHSEDYSSNQYFILDKEVAGNWNDGPTTARLISLTPPERETETSLLVADANRLFQSFVNDDLITSLNVAVSLFLWWLLTISSRSLTQAVIRTKSNYSTEPSML